MLDEIFFSLESNYFLTTITTSSSAGSVSARKGGAWSEQEEKRFALVGLGGTVVRQPHPISSVDRRVK